MPIELQDVLTIAGALLIWAAVDFVIVKVGDTRKHKKINPRGATAI